MSTPSGETNDRFLGRVIADKFRIDSLIGEGAMGRVYRADDLSRGKRVALKLLHERLGDEPRIAKRFHREAQAASRLSHPSSVSILEFGQASDGTLFLAMELLEGDDLQAIIDTDSPLSAARIADLMLQILAALENAHRAGIIHRDLKPENVVTLLDRDGRERVKVCDFGIAKIVEHESKTTAITKDGYVCGTPEYMAPEQARGEPIDARTDVYAAGVMLYQLLCARVPFSGRTPLAIIEQHIRSAPVPPHRVQPEWTIAHPLEEVALRALAKKKEDRFASAAEMTRAIQHAMREPATRAGRGWLVGLVAALGLFAFGVWLWILRP